MLDPNKNVPAWVRMDTTPKVTMAAFRATERFL
jgi:ribosomal protein L39E